MLMSDGGGEGEDVARGEVEDPNPVTAPPDAMRGRALVTVLEAIVEPTCNPVVHVPWRPPGTGVEGVTDNVDPRCLQRGLHPCGPGCYLILATLRESLERARVAAGYVPPAVPPQREPKYIAPVLTITLRGLAPSR